ncbi:hypothetical protein P4133_25895 [Pseudomonas aeruginosa]|nr:hypothetical protein [Pseudomonas aeruginosa]
MHYFIVHGRDFAQDDETVGAFHARANRSPPSSRTWLAPARWKRYFAEADEDSYEISVASDAPAVATRTHLKRRADDEAHQRAAHRVA